MDAVVTATQMAFSHDAHCPEISPSLCADPAVELAEHEHHQTVGLNRAQAKVTMGLGSGWQGTLEIPLDIKALSIEYTTPDGAPYNPPYGDIHHRNETLVGLGDGRVELQRITRTAGGLVVGGGLGVMLPLGRIEENPYALAAEGRRHQHVQMGSGTVDPVASTTAILMGHRWGFVSNASGRLPLMNNKYGFTPSPLLQVSIGPTYRFSAKTMAVLTAGIKHSWQATWDGEPDEMTGRTAIDAGGAMVYRLNPTIALMAQGRTTLAQWSKEAIVIQRFVGTIGLSFTPDGKAD